MGQPLKRACAFSRWSPLFLVNHGKSCTFKLYQKAYTACIRADYYLHVKARAVQNTLQQHQPELQCRLPGEILQYVSASTPTRLLRL